MTQHSIRPKRSTIRAQAVYFLHSKMPSVTCLRLSNVIVIYRFTYFQFPIQSAFLPYIGRQAARALRRTTGFDAQYRTSDVAENLGRYISCAERTSQWKDFQLILTVKIETRHHVEGQFGCEFPAICNHYTVMTAWSRNTWKFREQFLRFLQKRPLTIKFSKLFPESFHRFTDRRCCVEISWNSSDGKSAKSCVIYLTNKKISAASQTVAAARIAPKICQSQTPTMCSQCSRFHPWPR